MVARIGEKVLRQWMGAFVVQTRRTAGTGSGGYGVDLADCDNAYRYIKSRERGALYRYFWWAGGGSTIDFTTEA